MISLAIYQGQFPTRNFGDPTQLATHLEAYRYRLSDLAKDPNGDASFVRQKPEEKRDFDRKCVGHCVGGRILYDARFLAH